MPDDLGPQIPWCRRCSRRCACRCWRCRASRPTTCWRPSVDRTRDCRSTLVLVTADKDMLQLVSPRVRVFSTAGRSGDRVVFDEAAVKAKWGVEPEQIPDILALMGDSIDNIPGVPGVGEKTAAKLIGQFGARRSGSTRTSRWCRGSCGRRWPPTASRRCSRGSWRRSARGCRSRSIWRRFRGREPDWDRLRALWTELEFTRLLVQMPAPAPAATAGDVAGRWTDAAALAGYLARCRPARRSRSSRRRRRPAGPRADRVGLPSRRRAPGELALEDAPASISAGGR